MRILIGNVLFGLIVASWYAGFGNERAILLAGIVLALLAFVVGTCMGYSLNAPGAPTRRARPAPYPVVDASAFDHIQ